MNQLLLQVCIWVSVPVAIEAGLSLLLALPLLLHGVVPLLFLLHAVSEREGLIGFQYQEAVVTDPFGLISLLLVHNLLSQFVIFLQREQDISTGQLGYTVLLAISMPRGGNIKIVLNS